MSFIIDYEDVPVLIDALGTAEYEDRPHPAHDYRVRVSQRDEKDKARFH